MGVLALRHRNNPYMTWTRPRSRAPGETCPTSPFRQKYLGEAIENAGSRFGIEALRACIAPALDTTGHFHRPRPRQERRLERDTRPGRSWLHGAVRPLAGPWETTETRVIGYVAKARALIDSTGAGDPIVERLQEAPIISRGSSPRPCQSSS